MSSTELDFKKFDLETAMNALTKANTGIANDVLETTLRKVQIVGPRGPQGEPGTCTCHPRDGKDGKDGRPGADGAAGKTPILEIGSVTTGDKAAASFRRDQGVYLLDLILPKAERGPQGLRGESVVGPRGEVGATGATGCQGIQGIPGESIQGDPGKNAYPTDEMIEGIILRVLVKVIGNDLVLQKLVQVKAELSREVSNATARHIASLSDAYRRVSNIIG
jgi:hypothetical protein